MSLRDKDLRKPISSFRKELTLAWLACLLFSTVATQAAVPLSVDHPSGFYESAFSVTLSSPVAERGASSRPTECFPRLRTGSSTPARFPSPRPPLRAAAFDGESPPNPTSCQSPFCFCGVLKQSGAAFPASGRTTTGQPFEPYYRMASTPDDSDGRRVLAALQSIPSLSIITDPENLFSPQTGIYTHPLERGRARECAISAELLNPQGGVGFQVDCGLRIHGGMSRHAEGIPQALVPPPVQAADFGPARLQAPCSAPTDSKHSTTWCCAPVTTIPGWPATVKPAARPITSGTNGPGQSAGDGLPLPPAASSPTFTSMASIINHFILCRRQIPTVQFLLRSIAMVAHTIQPVVIRHIILAFTLRHVEDFQ